MTKLEKIEQDIAELSDAERRKLAVWLKGFRDDAWDRQMKADSKAGRLDKFLASAREEILSGKTAPL